jgi:two-component system, NarL family, invasion response regulator UvrY
MPTAGSWRTMPKPASDQCTDTDTGAGAGLVAAPASAYRVDASMGTAHGACRTTMIRLYLVDDHSLFRDGMRRILLDREDVVVTGEFATGEEAVSAVRRQAPDLVLMDINMPGIGGLEATRRITQTAPDVRVIVITVHSDDPFPSQMLDAGAMGYLSKGCESEELFTAIDHVMQGRLFFSTDVAQKLALARFRRGDRAKLFDQLAAREMQILMMIVQGLGNQQIADALFLSPKTISTYRHRLYCKLGVSNDVELTLLALRHGLLELD